MSGEEKETVKLTRFMICMSDPTLEEDMEQVYREVDDLDSLYDHLRKWK